MKRFIICILLVVGLIWAGDWTFDRLTEVKDHVLAEIDGISQLVERGEVQAAWERAAPCSRTGRKMNTASLPLCGMGIWTRSPCPLPSCRDTCAMGRSPPLRLRPTQSGGC